jgi:DNA polymerase III alpha subunit
MPEKSIPCQPPYAELHAISNFTFLRGASHPEELVREAYALGYSALALTDECSLVGVVRAHTAAKECGLKLIIGTEVSVLEGMRLVLLAMDRGGYGNLSALITRGRRREKKGAYRLARSDLEQGLEGCLALLISHSARGGETSARRYMMGEARWLAEAFSGRAWIAVELHREGEDEARLEELRKLGVRRAFHCWHAVVYTCTGEAAARSKTRSPPFGWAFLSRRRALPFIPTASATCVVGRSWGRSIPRSYWRRRSRWQSGARSPWMSCAMNIHRS